MEDVFSYLAAALIVVDVLLCLFCAEHTDVHSSLVGLLQSLSLGSGTAHGNIVIGVWLVDSSPTMEVLTGQHSRGQIYSNDKVRE